MQNEFYFSPFKYYYQLVVLTFEQNTDLLNMQIMHNFHVYIKFIDTQ